MDPDGNRGRINLFIRGKGRHKRHLYKSVVCDTADGSDIDIEAADEGTAETFLKLRGNETNGISPQQFAAVKNWTHTGRNR